MTNLLEYLFKLKKPEEKRYDYNLKKLKMLVDYLSNKYSGIENLCIVDWNLSKGKNGVWEESVPYYFKNKDALNRWLVASLVSGNFYRSVAISDYIFKDTEVKKLFKFVRCQDNGGESKESKIEVDNNNQFIFTAKFHVVASESEISTVSVPYLTNTLDKRININSSDGIYVNRKGLKDFLITHMHEKNIENFLNSIRKEIKKVNSISINPDVHVQLKRILYLTYSYFLLFEKITYLIYVPGKGHLIKRETGALIEESAGGFHFESFGSKEINNQDIEELLFLSTIDTRERAIKDWSSKTLQHALRSAVAAIMARNMSHNIGSHVLAGISQSEIKKHPRNMTFLTSYLQQRMDFVARVTTDWPEWREPVFFYSDLIQGFLSQALLLNYLIKDDGYEAKDIVFSIKEKSSEANWAWSEDTSCFQRQNGIEDFLVSIPGGSIGKQAFYGFIENAMRNAVKHNPKQPGLKVCVEIDRDASEYFYALRYYDNLSQNRGGLVDEIRQKLKTSLIDETGRIRPGDWGIQEMKIYADFLSYPHVSGDNELLVHQENGQRFRLWAESQKYEDTDVLSYRFMLQKANMVLVVDNKRTDREAAQQLGIRFAKFENGDELLKQIQLLSPQLLVFIIHDNDPSSLEKAVEFLDKHHLRLPGRILLVCQDKKKIEFLNTNDILRQRILMINKIPDYPKIDNSQNWQSFIIKLYKLWIQKFTQAEKFNLVVYFDRDKDSKPIKRWQRVKHYLGETCLSESIKVFLYYDDKETAKPLSDVDDVEKANRDGIWLFFDNHGKIKNLRKKLRGASFRQVIGHEEGTGINNFTIYDQFQNVPDGFTGALFLFYLIESSLLRVLVIDDRVAGYLVDKVRGDGTVVWNIPQATNFIDARIFFTISFRYTSEDRTWLFKVGEPKQLFNENIGNEEGVFIQNNEVQKVRVFKGIDENGFLSYGQLEKKFDAVVIHWGWLETQRDQKGLNLDKFLKSLLKICNRVIITSGRARTGKIPVDYPFIEFASLESYTMRELSKYHLGEALMSVF